MALSPGLLLAQYGSLSQLRQLNQQAELLSQSDPIQSAAYASEALAMAITMKDRNDPGLDLRLVSKEEIRAHLTLGDTYVRQDNERKATRHYRQALSIAEAIADSSSTDEAQARLEELGRSEESVNTRLGRIGRQLLEDIEVLVEEGSVDEEVKESAENATLSVMEWQARQAERRSDYPKAIRLYEQTLPYYLANADTASYRSTCGIIANLYERMGNEAEARRFRSLGQNGREQAIAAGSGARPDAVEDLRELVEESEAEEAAMARQEAETQQEASQILRQAEALARSGRIEESIERYRRAAELQDKLTRLQQRRRMDSAANAYFIETQLQEIELLHQQRQLQEEKLTQAQRSRNYLILGIGLAIVILGLVGYLFFSKRKAHRRLSQTFGQLESAHQELKATQTQLVEAEKMASLGQLTAGIAHEINNPVNFISGNLQPLRQDLQDLLQLLQLYEATVQAKGLQAEFSEVKAQQAAMDWELVRDEIAELMAGIEEGASRTTEIVQGLRTFARMDADQPQPVDIHQGLDSTLALLKNRLEGIEVMRDYGDLPEIEGFPGRLNQVFMNLLTNAVQAMPAGGWLRIRTQANQESVVITIQDTGQGIPETVRQRIFEPFFTTKPVGEGTGLGLSISLGIVQRHGGSIHIQSEPGHGTTVAVTLPILMPPEQKTAHARQ